MPADIFISYSHKDKEFVSRLVSSLEREWVVWWDSDLIFGERFEPSLVAKVAAIPVALVVLSENALTSEWVRRESDIALKTGHLIPVLKEKVPLPDNLRDRHYCDLVGWDGQSEIDALKQLHRDIRLIFQTQVPPSKEEVLVSSLSTTGKSNKGFGKTDALKVARYDVVTIWTAVGILLFIALAAFFSLQDVPQTQRSTYGPSAASIFRDRDETPNAPALDLSYLLPSLEQDIRIEIRELIKSGEEAEARKILEQGTNTPEEKIILSEMYDHGIGGSKELKKAWQILDHLTAEHKNFGAEFRMGMHRLFGRGVAMDIPLGLQMMEAALGAGFPLENARALLHRGCCIKDLDVSFLKQIDVMATKGIKGAKAFNAMLWADGLGYPHCITDCIDRAEKLAVEAKKDGDSKLTELAEIVIADRKTRGLIGDDGILIEQVRAAIDEAERGSRRVVPEHPSPSLFERLGRVFQFKHAPVHAGRR
jgi:TIR domain